MAVDILGRGIAFPFSFSKRKGGVEENGSDTPLNQIEHINQSLRQILGTEMGTRPIRRAFGSRLHSLVFEPNDEILDALVSNYVTEAVMRWEKRVYIVNVEINREERTAGKYLIKISFKIRKTNVVGTLIWPWYLAPEERGTGVEVIME